MAWLKELDKNLWFFHTEAVNRRQHNRLVTQKNEEGLWLEKDRLDAHIVEYFQSHLSASRDKGPMNFLQQSEKKIIDQMSEDLSRDFIEIEPIETLKQMQPTKATSPNAGPLSSSTNTSSI